jgi:hypothetical protein
MSVVTCSEGDWLRRARMSGRHVTNSQYELKERIQSRLKSVPCSLLSGERRHERDCGSTLEVTQGQIFSQCTTDDISSSSICMGVDFMDD